MVDLGLFIAGLVADGVGELLNLLSFVDFGSFGNTVVAWIQVIYDLATSWL